MTELQRDLQINIMQYFFKSSYSLVDCDVIDKSKQLGRELSKAKYENRKIELLCELLYELKNEQTIIYFFQSSKSKEICKDIL